MSSIVDIARLEFDRAAVDAWKTIDTRHSNWPVVYILDDDRSVDDARHGLRDVYVGETLSASRRFVQHLDTPAKQHLRKIRIILDLTFNKSVCLDLEAYLIKMLAGDGSNRVLNRNNGITESNFYQRELYRQNYRKIFDQLRLEGLFTRDMDAIENSDLFKLSPFKALSDDQAASVEEILRGFFVDLERGDGGSAVIQGDPGTGKTVIAIYLIKLLMDIKTFTSLEDLDPDSQFAEFFTEWHRRKLQNFRIGMVVPQQSLRESIKKVFKKTPGLHPSMVVHAFNVGQATEKFDLLVVDEAHRLSQRANQPSAVLNTQFFDITSRLYDGDDLTKTQLDWIQLQSHHQIFLLDIAQGVRPADIPSEILSELVQDASSQHRHFHLRSQMRISAGSDFVSYIREILDPHPLAVRPAARDFGYYDFRLFDHVSDMRDEVFRRDLETGLSRLVAGYAWEWKSRDKKDKHLYDIEIGGLQLRWNSTATDWIASPNALEEVGSIHTVQGYDLNYVGVIIGSDLRFDVDEGRLYIHRKSYWDRKGKENNPKLGRVYSDTDLLRFITQIYAVLLTRGIRGTYVYACDEGLRQYLRNFIRSNDTV